MLHLLQSMNLYWHIIVPQIPKFTPVAYSLGFDKCIVTYTHHYSIIQNSFTALKIPCDEWMNHVMNHLFIPSSSQTPKSLFCFYSFPFSRMPSSWNHTIFSHSRGLPSLSNTFKVPYLLWLNSSFLFTAE